MDDDVAQTNDLFPRHFCVLLFKVLRDISGCFADDLEMVNDPILDQLISDIPVASLRSVFLNSINTLENVEQPLLIPIHSGIASLSARARIRSFKLFSVKTSTLRPRIFSM